jgi:hypothetical protein
MAQLIDVPNLGQVEFPDDMSDDDIAKAIKRNALSYNQAEPKINATEGMSTTQKVLAGIGKGMTDLGRGAGQALGIVSDKEIADARALDEDLMSTGAGKVGNVVGQIASAAPAMLIPGANTYAGATLVGAATGALQPVTEDESRLTNTALGAAGGVAGQKLGNVIGNAVSNKLAKNALMKSRNATRDASLQAGLEAGYTVPRSLYNPTFLSNRIESIGGKAATLQQASIENQQVTNNLVRKALDLPEDAPLSMGTIEKVRKQAYDPYKAVSELSPGANKTLQELKQARADATGWFNAYNRSASPADLAKAKEFQSVADISEEVLEDYAKAANKSDLIPQLRNARKTIAKTYTVERALNKGTGDINAAVLGRLYDKNKPLSDGLDQIGRFATAFPKVARSNQDGAGISALEPLSAGMYAGLGQMATGNPAGLLAGGLPLLRTPARSLALSRLMQKPPTYGGGLLQLTNERPDLLPNLGVIGGGLLGANAN